MHHDAYGPTFVRADMSLAKRIDVARRAFTELRPDLEV